MKVKWLIRFFLYCVFFVAVVFLVRTFLSLDWSVLSILYEWKNFWILLVSVFLYVVVVLIGGGGWFLYVKDYGFSVSPNKLIHVYLISQMGKYLPGNVAQYLGRVVLANEIGIPPYVTLSAILVEAVWNVCICVFFSLALFVIFFDNRLVQLNSYFHPAILCFGLFFFLLCPWFFVGFLNRYFSCLIKKFTRGCALVVPKFRTTICIVFLFLLCYFIMGFILEIQNKIIFGNISSITVFQFSCVFSVSWLAGFVIPGAPGGVGVREAMMIFLLSPIVGQSMAVGLAVTIRLTTTIGDIFIFICSFIFKKYI